MNSVRDMLNNTIGNNLKKLRRENHINQEELAGKLNVKRQTISSYECGKSTPDIYTLIRISKIFQVTLDELVGNVIEKK